MLCIRWITTIAPIRLLEILKIWIRVKSELYSLHAKDARMTISLRHEGQVAFISHCTRLPTRRICCVLWALRHWTFAKQSIAHSSTFESDDDSQWHDPKKRYKHFWTQIHVLHQFYNMNDFFGVIPFIFYSLRYICATTCVGSFETNSWALCKRNL